MSILSRIADQMKRDAIKKFEAMYRLETVSGDTAIEHPLKGGAILRMTASHTEFSLLIMRVDVLPGEVEMKTFRHVFGVPPEIKAKTGRDTRRRLHYYWLIWDRPPETKAVQTPLEIKNEPAL